MSTENIFTAILDRIENAVGLPEVVMPNISGDPEGEHLRVAIIPATTSAVAISTTDRFSGILQVSVVVRDDTGAIRASEIADDVLALFPRNTEMVQGGDLIRIDTTGSVAAPIQGNGWYSLPVSIIYTLIK
jgi:hypothetical protein